MALVEIIHNMPFVVWMGICFGLPAAFISPFVAFEMAGDFVRWWKATPEQREEQDDQGGWSGPC